MIVVGEVDTKERAEALKEAMVAFLDGDEAVGVFWGGGNGMDFLAVEVVDRNGALWLMGRIRVLGDEVFFGSDDEKHQIFVAATKTTSPADWIRIASIPILVAATALGSMPSRMPCSAKTAEEFNEAIKAAVTSGGGRVAELRVDKPQGFGGRLGGVK